MFGRTEDYAIYDAGDMRRVIYDVLADPDREAVRGAVNRCGRPQSGELLAEMSLAKNRRLTPDQYLEVTRHRAGELVVAAWRECDRELERSHAVSFDDPLTLAVRMLCAHPERLQWARLRWRWLMIDEFQDVNRAQAELVSLLGGADGNVAIVGMTIRWSTGSEEPIRHTSPASPSATPDTGR
ncbi:MAG: UvrD-helicase domain-containing protein [Solirubrobacterales bacterium]|nr:UvrD-helicase domain-containing protein [Solirubrobacterales bacterium]